MRDLLGKFLGSFKEHAWWEEGDTLLVGVSGGVDSMVLLALCHRASEKHSLQLACAHVNYRLRGKESDAEQKLVENFCREKNILCYVARAPVKPAQKNLQAFAREFRHTFFLKIAKKIGATHIALGHHLEDQVETVLGHLLRGSGLHGLAGIHPKRVWQGLTWVRPLLGFRKKELLQFAQTKKIPYLDDSSNFLPKYQRNRLRQELLPQLEKLSGKSLEHIADLASASLQWSNFMTETASQQLKHLGQSAPEGLTLSRQSLLSFPKALRLELFRQIYIGLTGSASELKKDHLEKLETICCGVKGAATYRLPKKVQCFRRRENVLFVQNSL